MDDARSGRLPLALTLAGVAGAAGLAVYGLTRYPELGADHRTPIWIIVLAGALATHTWLAVVLSWDVRPDAAVSRLVGLWAASWSPRSCCPLPRTIATGRPLSCTQWPT